MQVVARTSGHTGTARWFSRCGVEEGLSERLSRPGHQASKQLKASTVQLAKKMKYTLQYVINLLVDSSIHETS